MAFNAQKSTLAVDTEGAALEAAAEARRKIELAALQRKRKQNDDALALLLLGE